MAGKVTIIVSGDGEVTVDAEGFKGAMCEKATKAIEKAFGGKVERTKKSSYYQEAEAGTKQSTGSGGYGGGYGT